MENKAPQKKEEPIITEDGQRLIVNEGLITGVQAPENGLAYSTGNTKDEKINKTDEENKNEKGKDLNYKE